MNKNPFLNLEEKEIEAPADIERAVSGNLGFVRFLTEIVELYLGKSGKVFTDFMKSFDSKQ